MRTSGFQPGLYWSKKFILIYHKLGFCLYWLNGRVVENYIITILHETNCLNVKSTSAWRKLKTVHNMWKQPPQTIRSKFPKLLNSVQQLQSGKIHSSTTKCYTCLCLQHETEAWRSGCQSVFHLQNCMSSLSTLCLPDCRCLKIKIYFMSFIESKGNNSPVPQPYIWHSREVKHTLKQLQNNHLLWEMVTSLLPQTRQNHDLLHHLDYKYISLHDLPVEHLGIFLNSDLLQFDLKGTVLVYLCSRSENIMLSNWNLLNCKGLLKMWLLLGGIQLKTESTQKWFTKLLINCELMKIKRNLK